MIGKVYKKEMKDTMRDRKTFLLMVLLPLILIVGMTIFFDQMMKKEDLSQKIPVAIHESVDVGTFKMLQSIPIVELTKSPDPMVLLKNGDVRIVLELEPDFARKMENGFNAKMTLYGDLSSLKTSKSMDALRDQLNDLQNTIVKNRLQAKGIDYAIVNPFDITQQDTSGSEDGSVLMVSYMLPLVIVMMVMIGGLPAAVDLFAGEKERKTMEALLIAPVGRYNLIVAKWLTITTIGTVSGAVAVLSYFLSVKFLTQNMGDVLSFGNQVPLILLSAILGILLFSMLFAALEMIISMMAKSFKEAQSYSSPLMFVGIIPVIALFGVTPNELSTYFFLIPFVNVVALLKELIYGVFSYTHLGMVIVSSIVAIGVVIAIATKLYSKDRWVLGK